MNTFLRRLSVFSLPIYMLVLILPLASERSIFKMDPSGGASLSQVVAGGIFLFLALAGNARAVKQNDLVRLPHPRDWAIILFFLWAFVSSLWSSEPALSAFYAIATWLVFVGCTNVWKHSWDHLRTMLALTAILLFVFSLATLLTYGVGIGRYVGALKPNDLGQISLVATLCSFLSGYVILRVLSFPLGIYLIMAVESRGSLLALVIFIGMYASLKWMRSTSYRKVIAFSVIGLVLSGVTIGALLSGLDKGLSVSVKETLALTDPERGWETGFTGRLERWRLGLDEGLRRPLVGYGYRMSTRGGLISAHNGWINLIRDVGMIGATVFFAYLFLEFVRHMRSAVILAAQTTRQAERAAVIASGIAALSVLAIFETQIINLGFPLAIFFIFLLSERHEENSTAPHMGKFQRLGIFGEKSLGKTKSYRAGNRKEC